MADDINRVKNFWESKRWTSFLASTAAGLQLNLTLIMQYGHNFSLSAPHPLLCPACRNPTDNINLAHIITLLSSLEEGPALCTDTDNEKLIVVPLRGDPYHGKFYILVREYTCCKKALHPSLKERAAVAQKILSSFQYALNEGFDSGRRALQLTALRQINHLALSLFNGEENILARVFDLILSALIILSDARGSWIEYKNAESTGNLFIKGNKQAVRNYITGQVGHADTTEIIRGENRVRLGIYAPGDGKQTQDLLNLMAQECILVLEIERLFKLLNKQLPMIFGAIASAAILVDKQGNITYVNQAAELLLGEKALHLIGEPIDRATGPWSAYIQNKTGRRVSGRMDNLIRKQQTRWVDWQVCPLLDEEQIAGWLILVDDRTDHHNWQEAARRAERLATTSALANSLAHELRNPLSAVKGLLQIIERRAKPDQIKGFTGLILQEIDRVTNLLNEFLFLGRPVAMAAAPLDLAAFLQELTSLLESEALNFEAEINLVTEKVPLILADRGQFTKVFLNLVRNALEAAGRYGRVTLHLYQSETDIKLTIKDNGPGLTAEASEKMFTPFFTTKERGTGLGLPIVQAIVHHHGGDITVENASGGGAICTVTLPSYTRCNEKIADIDVIISLADEQLRYPSEQALRTAGLSVISAADLNGVFLLKDRFRPAVLLADKNIAAPQNMKQLGQTWPHIRILAIAANDDIKETNNLQSITTPLDYVHLIELVCKTLEKTERNFPAKTTGSSLWGQTHITR